MRSDCSFFVQFAVPCEQVTKSLDRSLWACSTLDRECITFHLDSPSLCLNQKAVQRSEVRSTSKNGGVSNFKAKVGSHIHWPDAIRNIADWSIIRTIFTKHCTKSLAISEISHRARFRRRGGPASIPNNPPAEYPQYRTVLLRLHLHRLAFWQSFQRHQSITMRWNCVGIINSWIRDK